MPSSKKEASALLRHYSALLELHGANTFKVRGYANAAIALNSWQGDWDSASVDDLAEVEGLGKSVLGFLSELKDGKHPAALADLEAETPAGVMDIMRLPGLGAKKVLQLWKEEEIDSIDKLTAAAEEGRLAKIKGFGQKTVDKLLEAVAFQEEQAGKLLLDEAWDAHHALAAELKQLLPQHRVEGTGELRRHREVIGQVEFLIGYPEGELSATIHTLTSSKVFSLEQKGLFQLHGSGRVNELIEVALTLHLSPEKDFGGAWLRTTGPVELLGLEGSEGKSLLQGTRHATSEEEAFATAGLAFAPAPMREAPWFESIQKQQNLPETLAYEELKGILHNHSTYSDGVHSLRQMAENCKERGYEYLGISDHSQAAFYANGLSPYRVKEQQEEIEQLNKDLAPFRVFSGIESDILSDGSLDYEAEVLASFDFIVSSIHSPLNMDKKTATERLLRAIHNPYTTILGHSTGRLLLQREGYPIDHKQVIDAAAEQGVAIEINANAKRLDLDWRWGKYALDQGVMLCINPDAHSMEQYDKMYWGWLIAQKIGLPKEQCLNAFSLAEIESYFKKRKDKARES